MGGGRTPPALRSPPGRRPSSGPSDGATARAGPTLTLFRCSRRPGSLTGATSRRRSTVEGQRPIVA
eukprot:9828727-Alexandrium_andersonii.AAC.1